MDNSIGVKSVEELNSRQIQAKNTRENILNVVSIMLKDRDLDDISVQEICKEAKVSVGSFYHHFENKSAIIVELYKDVDVHFQKNIINYIDKTDPVNAIVDYLEYQCQHAVKIGIEAIKNIYKSQIDNGNLFFLSNDRGLPNGLRTLVKFASDEGLLRDDVIVEDLVSELLIMSRGTIYHWAVSNGEADMIGNIRKISKNYLKAFTV